MPNSPGSRKNYLALNSFIDFSGLCVNRFFVRSAPKTRGIGTALGLQVPINDQFHVFGKTTIGWASGTTNPDTKANPSQPDDKSTYFGLQSWAVGAIFYFN
jgi:hypothetical protein